AWMVLHKEPLALLGDRLNRAVSSAVRPTATDTQQQTVASAEQAPSGAPPRPSPFPLPRDYGIYALNNDALSELYLLSERVPDKRIAVSTPLAEPSRTTLPDGKAKFIIFRRELAGNAPDRVEVRVVAQVVRALSFDAKGRPNISPVSDAWNIR